jgi:hypothetical protein
MCRNFFVVPEDDVCESMTSNRGSVRNQERGEWVAIYERQEKTNEELF